MLLKTINTFFLAGVVSASLSQTFDWSNKAGGSMWDEPWAIHVGSDNNVVATGMFVDAASFGTNNLVSSDYQDGFVAKYDASGNYIWVNAINGASGQVWGQDVTTDGNDNVYVVGYFQSPAIYFTPTDSIALNSGSSRDVFLVKYNSSGVFQWAVTGEGTFSTGRAVTCDNQNNVIIAGDYNTSISFAGTTLPSTSATNTFMVKFTDQGVPVWAEEGASGSLCWIKDLDVDASDNIYVAGKISNPITFGGTTVTGNTGDDMIIGKFNSSGVLQWMDVVGKPIVASTTSYNFDSGNGIAVDQSGNVYVGGALLDTTYYDVSISTLVTQQFATIRKYDTNGNIIWSELMTGNHEDNIIRDVAVDSNGDPYVIGSYNGNFSVGSFTLTSQTIAHGFAAKLSQADGSALWAHEHGTGFGSSQGFGIAINPTTNDIFTCGNFQSGITFGSNTLTSSGSWDIYLTKLNGTVGLTDNIDASKIKPYPNPTSSLFNVTLPDAASNAELSIYSMSGRLVMQEQINAFNPINIESLADGNYLITIRTEIGVYKGFIAKQ